MHPDVWHQAERALNDLDYPASKEQVVAHAADRGAADDVLRLLRAIPLGDYDNLAQLRQSVRLDPAAEEDLTPSRQTEQKRSAHSRQIAEHLRDVEEPPVRRRGGI